MNKLLLVLACFLSPLCLAEVPIGVEVFKKPGLRSPMEIKTSSYHFTVEESHGMHLIKGMHVHGGSVAHEIHDGGVKNVRRLFVLESHACGAKFIDLVLQMEPGEYEESGHWRYYRIVFSSDLTEVVSEFYDPSVSAIYAVLPIQNVEGLEEPELGSKIVCDGPVPTVVYP